MVPQQDADAVRSRTGRHRGGRPGPEGTAGPRPGTGPGSGRHGARRRRAAPLRLPAIRVSGAAMAMSTVVGISVATTWIVTVQNGMQPAIRISDVDGASSSPGQTGSVGRPSAARSTASEPAQPPVLAGRGSPQESAVSRDDTGHGTAPARPAAGSSAPLPSASASSVPPAPATDASSPAGTTGAPDGSGTGVTSPGGTSPGGAGADGTSPGATTPPATGEPSGAPSGPATPGGSWGPRVPGGDDGSGASASDASPAPDPAGSAGSGAATSASLGLAPVAAGEGPADEGLRGAASAHTTGPDGSWDSLQLTVEEPLTALEVEVRIGRAGGASDCGAWSSMPGTALTVTQDGGALVYRFTLLPGETVQPGGYSFTVQYAHRSGPHDAAGDTWLASAFGVARPRAVAVRGTFG